jgi:hypothetical protein
MFWQDVDARDRRGYDKSKIKIGGRSAAVSFATDDENFSLRGRAKARAVSYLSGIALPAPRCPKCHCWI